MRLVVQRVQEAEVVVDSMTTGRIGKGLMVLLGIHKDDQPQDTHWLVNKLLNLRIFNDDQDKMNLSVQDVLGQVLVVSQFTLYGNCSEGRRPEFTQAAPPPIAIPIYEKFLREVKEVMGDVQAGIFGADMKVSLINDGPVTVIVESKK